MAGGNRGGAIQFADLRLRLQAVSGGVQGTLTRASDNLTLADEFAPTSIQQLRTSAKAVLAGAATDRAQMSRVGTELGNVAFSGKVGEALLHEASRHQVRIRISGNAELNDIPWEMSILAGLGTSNDGYVALCGRVSLTWDVEAAIEETRRPSENTSVLVAWANPGSAQYPPLHFAEKEAASVIRALKSAECRSLQVDELPFATIAGLMRSLKERRPDVLHFIGHGDLAPSGGLIVLEGGLPATDSILYAEDLAKAVVEAGTTLAVLSGCLTSGSPQAIGNQLAKAGVPAVLAMSVPIQDAAAHQFARAMYSSLAEGTQLDEAVFEGRCAIYGMGSDWAAPQLMISGSKPLILTELDENTFKWQASERKTNLGYDDRPFIGRMKERADLRAKIRDQGQRLVTITGPGGMGKTRLSKQVAAELLGEFPDGVWFVDCEALITDQELTAGIAAALPFATGADSLKAVQDSLVRRRTLIVLDCFENSIALGGLVESLLQSAPNLHVLLTSRIVLGLPREHEYPLPPMSTTDKGGASADSITLFAEAASHAISDFEVTAKNRKLLRELCGSLEGVPLAIVLAAGRLRHMSLAELLEQVRTQPIAILRRRTGGIDRHSNIEAVVDASFSLLPRAERQMLCKLGLFYGSFTLADASAVCGISEAEQILWISDLRDHSLVHILRDEARTRYKLLDTVRDYISRLTFEGPLGVEIDACRRRHAEHYSALAIEIGRLMAEGRWSSGPASLMQDIGNLRAAMQTAVHLKRDDLIAAMTGGLARRFFEAGLLTDFRILADAGYETAERTGDPTLRIQLLGLEGALASRQGEEERCEQLWLERVALSREQGDIAHCADALIDLAWQAFENNDPTKSRLRLIEALRLARSVKDPTFIATAKIVQARIAFASKNLRLARVRNLQAEKLLAQCADRNGSLFVCQLLSMSSRELGDIDRSIDFTLKLLRLSIERNQVIHAGWSLLELGPIYEQTNQLENAARCYLGAMKVHAEYATRHRTRAATAFAQFRKRQPGGVVTSTINALRNHTWTEIVDGLS